MKTYIKKNIFRFLVSSDEIRRDLRVNAIIRLFDGYMETEPALMRATKNETERILETYYLLTSGKNLEKSPYELAKDCIKSMVNYGYLETEYDQRKEYYVMTPEGMDIARLLKKMEGEDEELPEGYFASIFNILNNTNSLLNHPYTEVLQPVYKNFQHLMDELRKMTSVIHREMQDMLSDDIEIKSLDELYMSLDSFFNSKKWDLASRLIGRDNFDYYRNSISSRIANLNMADNIDRMADELVESGLAEDREHAVSDISAKLGYIETSIDCYRDIIMKIIYRITRYHNAATNRIGIIKNTDTNLHGKITAILKDMAQDEPVLSGDDLENISSVYSKKMFDLEKIFSADFSERRKVVTPVPEVEDGDDDGMDLFREILEPHEYSFDAVNRQIMEVLETRGQITPYNSSDIDLMLLCIIPTYMNASDRCFDMEIKDNAVTVDGREITDFVIRKRKDGKDGQYIPAACG